MQLFGANAQTSDDDALAAAKGKRATTHALLALQSSIGELARRGAPLPQRVAPHRRRGRAGGRMEEGPDRK